MQKSRFLSIPQWNPSLRLQDTQTGPEISILLKRITGNINSTEKNNRKYQLNWKETEILTLLKGTGKSSNEKKFHNSNNEDRKWDFCWREPEYQLPWTEPEIYQLFWKEPEISTLLKRTGNIKFTEKNSKYQLYWKPNYRSISCWKNKNLTNMTGHVN